MLPEQGPQQISQELNLLLNTILDRQKITDQETHEIARDVSDLKERVRVNETKLDAKPPSQGVTAGLVTIITLLIQLMLLVVKHFLPMVPIP